MEILPGTAYSDSSTSENGQLGSFMNGMNTKRSFLKAFGYQKFKEINIRSF